MSEEIDKIERIFGEACHNMERCIEEVICPFCGVSNSFVKNNGNGYYRCKGKCKRNFFLVFGEYEEFVEQRNKIKEDIQEAVNKDKEKFEEISTLILKLLKKKGVETQTRMDINVLLSKYELIDKEKIFGDWEEEE